MHRRQRYNDKRVRACVKTKTQELEGGPTEISLLIVSSNDQNNDDIVLEMMRAATTLCSQPNFKISSLIF